MSELPMFPLGTVLFPHALLPLHVFEPRYRLMTKHVMDGDKEFGVVLIERGSEVGGGDVRFDVATVARIVQISETSDGRYTLMTAGMRRVRVVEWLPDNPYPRADVEPLSELPPSPGAAEARVRVIDALARVTEVARMIDDRIEDPPELDAEPARASYEAAALAPVGALDAQRVLEESDATVRLGMLEALIEDRIVDLRARLDFER